MQWMKSLMNWKADIKMLKYDVVLTRQAKRDLVDIGDYISYTLLEPRISYKLIIGLREKISSLRDMPQRCALISDPVLATQGIRCLPYKKCSLL